MYADSMLIYLFCAEIYENYKFDDSKIELFHQKCQFGIDYISYVGFKSNQSWLAKQLKFGSLVLVIHFAQKENIFHSIKLFWKLGTHVSSNPICLK